MALARITLVFMCGLCLAISQRQAAEPFLQKQAQRGGSLIADLEAVLGHDFLRGRLAKLETRLRPMFLSLPKSSRDLVGHAAARYALHRANMDFHGWSITGLEPTISTFNTTSLVGSGILRELVPPYVEDIFETHIAAQGFGLRDLAALAGTIEHFVHDGHRSILRKVCEIFDLPTMGPMSEQDMMYIIRLYKALLLRGTSTENLTRRQADQFMREAPLIYPGWIDASTFLDDERNAFAFTRKDRSNPFDKRENSLQVAVQVVDQVADHFTLKHNEPECQEIKEDLLTYERGDTGRIRLVDFYRASLDSRFFYVETKEYLRAIGALDESDTLFGPKVIVSNYVQAKINCMAQTDIYSICCVQECDGLYGQLEQDIVAPDGTPEQILSLAAKLSSSTVQAPRNLSQALRSRLEEIAIANGGRVLLHGRLFGQWMHQAFPRECPYPHLVGTTTSLLPGAWSKQMGLEHRIDSHAPARAVLGGHIAALELSLGRLDVESATEGDDADLMWTNEEEHFAEPTRSFTARVGLAIQALSRVVVALFALGCVALALALKSKWLLPRTSCATADNYFV